MTANLIIAQNAKLSTKEYTEIPNPYKQQVEDLEKNLVNKSAIEKARIIRSFMEQNNISIEFKQIEKVKFEVQKIKAKGYEYNPSLGIDPSLEEELKKVDPQFECISYVDTGPVMDKAWAVHAGIGWLGKHTNVINREIGSWFFIANIITNYEFDYSEQIPDICGTCTACVDACPTNAIIQEYVVDANNCISYLTIENKNEISEQFKVKFDNWLFGCDICQDVCPWNQKFPAETLIKDFHPQNKELKLDDILEMNEEEFKEKFQTSPIKRAKISGLKRNATFLKK